MAEANSNILGICSYSALQNWCILHPFGAGVRCCGPCCGSCCDSTFNEDNFDERMKKEQAKNGANPEPAIDSQPGPSQGMSAVSSDPKPIIEEAR